MNWCISVEVDGTFVKPMMSGEELSNNRQCFGENPNLRFFGAEIIGSTVKLKPEVVVPTFNK